jgi:hypothetical protein
MPWEVSMPTQIPIEGERSWAAAAKAALLLSLLSAAIVSGVAFIIVWAYG